MIIPNISKAILPFAFALLLASPLLASEGAPTKDAIETGDPLQNSDGFSPGVLRLQIMLGRAEASTGWVDGLMGPSTERAIAAYEEMQGMKVDGSLDDTVWKSLQENASGDVMQEYALTEEDVNTKLVENFDAGEWDKMRKLDCLCYHRMSEMLAEKFHMDEELLKRLNPDADFTKAGTKILVANVAERPEIEIARVVVDKSDGQVRGYDASEKLVWATRAAVGSEQTPSPSGTVKINALAMEPTYTFDPKNYPNTDLTETFDVAAGPNGPVGGTWIDLSKPTYGLHGTPHPEQMNTMASHGCVRMTNWDVEELAFLVKPGVPVEFTE